MNYIYGTWSVLCALNAVGVDHGAPEIRKAVGWLVAHPERRTAAGARTARATSSTIAATSAAPSTASQTAWALLGLMAAGEVDHPAVARGIDYLARTQGADGLLGRGALHRDRFPARVLSALPRLREILPALGAGALPQPEERQCHGGGVRDVMQSQRRRAGANIEQRARRSHSRDGAKPVRRRRRRPDHFPAGCDRLGREAAASRHASDSHPYPGLRFPDLAAVGAVSFVHHPHRRRCDRRAAQGDRSIFADVRHKTRSVARAREPVLVVAAAEDQLQGLRGGRASRIRSAAWRGYFGNAELSRRAAHCSSSSARCSGFPFPSGWRPPCTPCCSRRPPPCRPGCSCCIRWQPSSPRPSFWSCRHIRRPGRRRKNIRSSRRCSGSIAMSPVSISCGKPDIATGRPSMRLRRGRCPAGRCRIGRTQPVGRSLMGRIRRPGGVDRQGRSCRNDAHRRRLGKSPAHRRDRQ